MDKKVNLGQLELLVSMLLALQVWFESRHVEEDLAASQLANGCIAQQVQMASQYLPVGGEREIK